MLMVIVLAASVMPMSVFTQFGGGVAFADTFPDKDRSDFEPGEYTFCFRTDQKDYILYEVL